MNSRSSHRVFLSILSLVAAIGPSGCVAEGTDDFVDENEENVSFDSEAISSSSSTSPSSIDDSTFFVWQVYLDVLERAPDQGGLVYFVNVLNACNGASACLTSNRTAIARAILESPENVQQDPVLTPGTPSYKAAYVWHCYTNFLRRDPDSAGYTYWLNYLNSTGDFSGVVKSVITSPEYRQRFAE